MPDFGEFPNMDVGPRKEGVPPAPTPQDYGWVPPIPARAPEPQPWSAAAAADQNLPRRNNPPGEGGLIGQRVLAPWGRAWLYPARIDEIREDEVHVVFEDGNYGRQAWVPAADLRPMDIGLGSRISCRWLRGWIFYNGVIAQQEGERIFIHYDDGDREWNTISMTRVATGSWPSLGEFLGSALGKVVMIAIAIGVIVLIRLGIWFVFNGW
jgi:hypothetical protein